MRLLSACLTFAFCLSAQAPALRLKVHAASLESNLAGDSPDRDVSIYLPPSYAKSPQRRYPVLYLLHGFTDTDEQWMGFRKHFVNVPASAAKIFAAGSAREMIVVMPNAFTRFEGSMYSSSSVTGDWETFIARDLVAYIDSHYRTLARPESRGLAGHSMGGYGAIRLAMKRPGVFSSVYSMSPCCLTPPNPQQPYMGAAKIEAVASLAEIAKTDFFTKAALASAAAWSPNPQNPPLYLDLPTKNGEVQPLVVARWTANAPVAMVDQYTMPLKQLKALALDMGDRDQLIRGAQQLAAQFTKHGVPHTLEIYEGDHINRVSDRLEAKVFPFFSQHLDFGPTRR